MDMGKLSGQFMGLVERAADQGVDLAGGVPGMVRMNGIHVPTAYSVLSSRDFGGSDKVPGFGIQIPDERGNLFHVSVHPDADEPFTAKRAHGKDNVLYEGYSSPEELMDAYASAPTPDEHQRKNNQFLIDRMQGVRKFMGAERMEMPVTFMPGSGTDVWGTHLFNPGTGDLRKANMPMLRALDAHDQEVEKNRRDRLGRRSEGDV